MYMCYLCPSTFNNIKFLSVHLRNHKTAGKEILPAVCLLQGCNGYKFSTIDIFTRHLKTKHENIDNQINTKCMINEEHSDHLVQSNVENFCNPNVSEDDKYKYEKFLEIKNNEFLDSFNTQLFFDIIYFKSKVNCSESLLNDVLNKFGKLIEKIMDHFFTILSFNGQFEKNEFRKKEWFDKLESIAKLIKTLKDCFNNFNSTYKQTKLIKQKEKFIEPQSICLGQRVDTINKNGKLMMVFKRESFEYVSIIDTLKALLSNKKVKETIKNEKRDLALNPYLISQSNFWGNKNTLKILLFYDEVEIRNPLGDCAGIYKLGMFYFTLLNLTRKHNANLKNIYLLATCFSEDIKKYGVNSILRCIINDVKSLETDGIEIDNENYHASIFQVCGDNLGIHQLFNLKCNFIGEQICHLCNASTQKIQHLFSESDFELTSYSKYLQILESNEINSSNSKPISLLNELKYFKITQNYSFDITHDLFEGIIPLELRLIIEQFIFKEKFFTFDHLNEKIKLFNYGKCDFKDKPGAIRLDKKTIKIKQTARKMQCFFNLFSFFVGEKIPEGNKFWKLYLSLNHLVQIIISPKISFNNTCQLKYVIEDHHDLYLSLFPEESLKKKHHNLIHYPRAIRELGNLIDFSTIRFEAKHSFIKNSAKTIHNSANVLKSVSKKHQIFNLYNLMNDKQLNESYEILSYENVKREFLDKSIILYFKEKFNDFDSVDFLKTNLKIKLFGTNLEKNMFMLVDDEKKKTNIAKIDNITLFYERIFFSFFLYKIVNFNEHFHAYNITATNLKFICDSESLYHYHPFSAYESKNNELFVKPPCIFDDS